VDLLGTLLASVLPRSVFSGQEDNKMNKRMCFALIGISSIFALASSSVLAEAPAVKADSMTSHGASGAPGVRTAPARLRERSPEQVDTNYGWRPNADVDRASSPYAGGGVQ
jgi:hypothetical protein